MRSINKVILIGNLTRDPEMRQTPNGQNVVTFGIATNREWVTRDGRKQSMTEFHDLVAWANLADICGKYLKKSKLVYIEGYLKTRSWDTPEGVRKFKTEIVVQDMIMLDKRQAGEGPDFIPQEEPVTAPADNNTENEIDTEPAVEETMPKTPAQKAEKAAPRTIKSPAPAEVDIDKDLGL
jgi:single-strand DNA-binding protein